MADIPDKAFWAKCRPCGHCWPAAYWPMDAVKFAKIAQRAVCPKCGEQKRVIVAKQDNGVLQEPSSERGIPSDILTAG